MTKTVLIKRALAVLAACLVASMLGCAALDAQRIETMERERDVGEGYLAERNIPKAIFHFQRAQRAYPKEPSVYFGLGLAYHIKGDREKAAEYYEKAIDIKPNYSEAHLQLGNLAFESKDYDSAVSLYEKALENDIYTTPHFAHFNIARVHHERNRLREAKEHYEKALRLVPDYTDAHYYMGVLYLEQKEPEDAIKSLKKAILYGHPYPAAKMTLGKAYMEAGQKDKAIEALRQSLVERPPEDVRAEAKRLLKLLGAE